MATVLAMSGLWACGMTLLLPLVILLLIKGFESAAKAKIHRFRVTTDCGGVAPGPVEVKGVVKQQAPLEAPVSQRPAVYYEVLVRDQVGGEWRTSLEDEKATVFYLEDESGRVQIDPRGAEFHVDWDLDQMVQEGDQRFRWGPSPRHGAVQRQLREKRLSPGAEVYILGHASERADLAVPQIKMEAGEPFVISDHDESHLIRRYERSALLYLVNAYFLSLPIPAGLTALFGGMSFGEALVASIMPTFLLIVGMPLVLWGIYRLNHYGHVAKLRKQIQRGRQVLRQECKHRDELIDRLEERLKGGTNSWTVQTRLKDGQAQRERLKKKLAVARTSADLREVIDEQSKILDRLFTMMEALWSPDQMAADEGMVGLLEELTRSEHRLVMGRNFVNDGLRRLWDYLGDISHGERDAQLVVFEEFEGKPIDVLLSEDPEDRYSGDVEASERRVEIDLSQLEAEDRSESPQASLKEEEVPEVSDVPDVPDTPDVPDVPDVAEVPETAPIVQQRRVSERESQEEDEWEGRWPTLEPIRVNMRFGEEGDPFAEVGRFGEARDFESLSLSDGAEERARREAFRFGEAERPWPEREPYGFSDEDKRGVVETLEE